MIRRLPPETGVEESRMGRVWLVAREGICAPWCLLGSCVVLARVYWVGGDRARAERERERERERQTNKEEKKARCEVVFLMVVVMCAKYARGLISRKDAGAASQDQTNRRSCCQSTWWTLEHCCSSRKVTYVILLTVSIYFRDCCFPSEFEKDMSPRCMPNLRYDLLI